MSTYPAGSKTTDQCTYQEMVDRFWWEIRRAIRLDWDGEIIDNYRKNLEAFLTDYRGMEPRETIGRFKQRTAA
jgi:hypothetical protein